MGSYTRKVSPQNIWLCCVIAKLRLALCDPMDYSPPGSSVNGILQARILEWVTIPFSGGSSWPRDWTHMFCIAGSFFTTEPPWEAPKHVTLKATRLTHGKVRRCEKQRTHSIYMFSDWKNQYCENVYTITILFYTIQSNLQTQCNFYQITNGNSHRIRTQNFTICMGTQMTLNS